MPELKSGWQGMVAAESGLAIPHVAVVSLMVLGLFSLLLLIAAPGVLADQTAAPAPDLAREQRMASEIVDAILDGDPVDLRTREGQGYLGIFTEATGLPAKGTVIILHGRGHHPDWVNVVQPLRVGLIERGWNSLSIQLPVLHKSAKYYDYIDIFGAATPRIEAAIARSRESSAGKVVILAHSCGSHMAQHWVHARGQRALDQFDAFIGIGMGATDYGQPMKEPFALDKMKVPVLDIYAQDDFPAVLRMAPARLAALQKGGNAKSAQVVIPDAEHYFVDRGDPLLEAVSAWLDAL